jgi:hypothetical protein
MSRGRPSENEAVLLEHNMLKRVMKSLTNQN